MIKKVTIIAFGKVKEKYIREGIAEYLKRLTPFAKVEIIELKDEGPKKEAEKIKALNHDNIFLLDEKGSELTSHDLAKEFKKLDGEITFVIGGAEGIDDSIKKDFNKISLSKMTFVHEMCRLFLVEQVYRSYMINNNRKYHK